MKLEKTNGELIQIYQKITSQISWWIPCKKLAASIVRNMRRLETKVLNEQADFSKPTDSYLEYVKESVKIWEHYAEKDDKWFPLKNYDAQWKETSFTILPAVKEIYEAELKKIDNKYPEVVKWLADKNEKYKAWLDTKQEIEFDTVKLKELPNNITSMWLSYIWLIVEDLYLNL
jgi:hypothetical protein